MFQTVLFFHHIYDGNDRAGVHLLALQIANIHTWKSYRHSRVCVCVCVWFVVLLNGTLRGVLEDKRALRWIYASLSGCYRGCVLRNSSKV